MNKPVRIIILLVLAMTGFDAARPFFSHSAAHPTTSFVERTEFWSFVVFVAVLGGAFLFRRIRSGK